MSRIMLCSKINWLLCQLAKETTEQARHNTCAELHQLYSIMGDKP